MSDNINSPSHYARLSPEPIDVITQWQLPYTLGNVVKYVARAGYKDASKRTEDLRKAAYYLAREIMVSEKADRRRKLAGKTKKKRRGV